MSNETLFLVFGRFGVDLKQAHLFSAAVVLMGVKVTGRLSSLKRKRADVVLFWKPFFRLIEHRLFKSSKDARNFILIN